MLSISDFFNNLRDTLPKLELDLLIAHAIDKSREYVLAHPEYKLNAGQAKKLDAFISRRLNNEPIAYITGHKEFYSRNFLVSKSVLVPRPETELMVEEAVRVLDKWLSSEPPAPIHVIDIGTGSGCIILTVAKEIEQKSLSRRVQNNIRFTGIDISKRALRVAAHNCKEHGLDATASLIHGNLLQPLLTSPNSSQLLPTSCNLLILANLPYLTPGQIAGSPSIRREPKLALEAGCDGLKYYRRLLKQISQIAKKNSSLKLECIFEIDETQTVKFQKLLNDYPFIRIRKIIKDFQGLDRQVVINVMAGTHLEK